jgi:predicted ribosomally synthesized peptide with SipW-like signal peptide
MLAIFLVIGLVGTAGTFAWFQDTETSTGNTLTAGTLDLKIRDGDEAYGDGVTATWTATKPNQTSYDPYDPPRTPRKNPSRI